MEVTPGFESPQVGFALCCQMTESVTNTGFFEVAVPAHAGRYCPILPQ